MAQRKRRSTGRTSRSSTGSSKGKASKYEAIGALAGVILVLATFSIFLSIIYFFVARSYYNDLYNKAFNNRKYQRVIDTKKAVVSFLNIIIVIGGGAIGLLIVIYIIGNMIQPDVVNWVAENIPYYMTVGGFCILSSIFLYGPLSLMAKRVAVVYIGTFVDLPTKIIYFPYEFNSYSLGDWFNLNKIRKDLISVSSIKMAEVTRMTRDRGFTGDKGMKLYVHGSFGSKCLEYSSKQKRDEAMAMIQALSGKKGLIQFEVQ